MPRRERCDDATPGHGGLDGEVLCLQRGRIFAHHGTDKIQLFLNSAYYCPQVWQLGTTYNFRFSRTRDVGISVYLVIVTIFFYTKTPLGKVENFLDFEPQLPFAEIINPVFLADPLGALVGKNLTQLGVWNPKWVGDKTIGQMK